MSYENLVGVWWIWTAWGCNFSRGRTALNIFTKRKRKSLSTYREAVKTVRVWRTPSSVVSR
eukprot:3466151-Prymnesium_polylepis.1